MAKGWKLTNTTNDDLFGGADSGLGGMDLEIDSSGHTATLTGRERVRHDVLKGILTGRTGDYGTTLPSLIGQKRQTGFAELIAASVQKFLDDYRDNQPPDLPDEETIESIRALNIKEDPLVKTNFLVIVALNMADGQTLDIEHRF